MMETTNEQNFYLLSSWRLWKYLLNPQESAIFERIIKQDHKYKLTMYHLCLIMVVGFIISYATVSYLRPLELEFPIIGLIVLIIFSSAITIAWLVNIAARITHEHQNATYDLICVTPSGKMGANWSIATATLHRQNLFRWIELGRRWLSGAILLIFMSVLIPVILSTLSDRWIPPTEVIILFFEVLVFVIFTYVEYMQSVLQGVLIAMLLPRYVHRTADVSVWAISAFITLQVIVVTVFLIGGLFIQQVFLLNQWEHSTILPQLLLLFIIREVCITSLWKLLSYHLNAKAFDLNHI